jgi:hypothetical protein
MGGEMTELVTRASCYSLVYAVTLREPQLNLSISEDRLT